MGLNKLKHMITRKNLLYILIVVAVLLIVEASYGISDSGRIKRILRSEFPNMFGRGSVVIGPLTVEELESPSYTVSGEYWEEIKSSLQEGDEIYYFRTDDDSWSSFAGSIGFAVMRGDTVIHTMLTMMS